MTVTTFLNVANRAAGTLLADISDVDTSLTLQAGEGAEFPSTFPFHITSDDEILKVEARSGDVLSSLSRGEEGTTPAGHVAGANVRLHITAEQITDIHDAIHDLELDSDHFNGTFAETLDADISEAGGVVTLSLQQEGTGDLTMRFSDGLTILDCTPAVTIALTLGGDDSPQANYIYIPIATKVLTKSTTQWPATEHIKIGYSLIPSAAFVSSNGPYIQQQWNDHRMGTTGQGHMAHMAERERLTSARYFSGIDPNGTTSYLTIVGATVDYKATAGVIFQMHRHVSPAVDTSAGDEVLVVNWNGDAYHNITNLFDIVEDSGGNTIGNNKWFNLVIWGVANKAGSYEPVMINLPSGFYNTQASAEQDISAFDNFDLPREFDLESSTAFLIARLTIQKQAGTWAFGSVVDLRRGDLLGARGGASSPETEFADNALKVFDATDNSKVFEFQADQIAPATTRTLTVPDADGTLLLAEDSVDALADVDTVSDAPNLNEVLKWDGSNWVPGTAGDTTEFTFSIDSFTDNIADTNQLIGSGEWKAIGAITFEATYSNAPGGMTAEVALSGSSTPWGGNLSMTPVTGPETNAEAVDYPAAAGGTIVFTLSQSADATEDTETVTFNNTMRYGNSALTQGNQTEATLEALSEVAGPSESRNQTIFNIPTTANYLVFGYADRLSDVAQVQMNSGFGYVTASFAAAATTLAPLVQTGVANVDNSAGFSETFACITSRLTGLADGANDFKLLTSATAIGYLYWGELAVDAGGDGGGVYTEANVEDNYATQPGKVASNSISSRSMIVNAGAGEYTYIAYPARLGALSSIIIGGFESIGDFWIDNTALAITNDAGYQEDYRVYVSKNPGFTDPTTMTVSL